MKVWTWRRVSVPAPVMLIALATAIGCGSVADQPPDDRQQQLPFTENKPLVVPANTMVYVRLQQPIMSATAQPGQTFSALLDESLRVENQTVASQGAEVTGKVVAAHQSGRVNTAGYVRITLSSITVNGKAIPLQTNSAIAGGGRFKNRDLSFGFMRGRTDGSPSNSFQATDAPASGNKQPGFAADSRIGFRLTQPLTVN